MQNILHHVIAIRTILNQQNRVLEGILAGATVNTSNTVVQDFDMVPKKPFKIF